MEELTRLLSSLPQLDQLLDRLRGAPLTTCAGAPDGVIAFVAGRVAVELARPVVIVCESDEAARDRHAELAGIYPQVGRLLLDPTTPALPSRLAGLSPPAVVVVTAAALDAPAPVADDRPAALDIRPGCGVGLPGLAQWLEENGYQRTDLATERGEYAVRGGIVDVFPDDAEDPVRIEIGDELVVSLRAFDPLSQRSRAEASDVSIPTRRPARSSEVPASTLLPVDAVVMTSGQGWGTATTLTIAEDSNADCDLGCRSIGSYMGNADLLRSEVERSGDKYYVVSGSSCRLERLSLLLGPKPRYLAGPLSSGFACPALHAVVLTEREVYGTPAARRPRRRFKGLPVDNLIALRPGDHVVHIDYGVGMFEGTRRMMHAAVEKDYIVLKYAGRDRVYVPVENLSLLDRYVGGDAEAPALDRLGGRSWLMAKAKAARASAEYAKELLDLHARRRLASGTTFPVDTHDQAALEAAFPWQETPDQLTALAEVKRDMQSARPMDRLICGDVGFGKTEVALRAAFKAAMHLKQVALLCPTTILAYQHYVTFRRRLEPFPLRVEMLSRFTPPTRRREAVAGIAGGRVDVVIGTHLLLGRQVRFRDLGLLIIDEEQKFGSRQKERIRTLKAGADVLTLTATPIPRTLYMALAGLRDISAVHTPPPGRREIETEVAEWSDALVRDYVYRELNRGGQVFFVHNEIQTIRAVRDRLCRLLPDIKMAVAHGQMPNRRLADIYVAFAAGEFDLLLSTAIVESGLDMPNVNTIIVDRADRFGLADLHQLRGRVGRSQEQAYALCLIPARREITAEARKRLSALLAYSQLGSGYRLALRDMEIRGVGSLLGTEQHGHVARIGFTLYAQMLGEAVSRLKGEPVEAEPELSIELPAFIPMEYIADAYERIALYRRLLAAQSEQELAELRAELVDRFGRYPPVVEGLFNIALVRVRARRLGLLRVTLKKDASTVVGPGRTETVPGGIEGLLRHLAGSAR